MNATASATASTAASTTTQATIPDTAPALVLGAGLMGRLLACELAQRGHAVTLVDAGAADATGSAARVAAAMLAPLAESAVTERSVVAMGQHGLIRWPELIARLSQPVFFQAQGTLVLWHRQDEPEARRFAAQLAATGRELPSLPRPQTLDGSGIGALEPALAGRFSQGLFLPHEGQLDNRELLQALLHTLQQLDVELRWMQPMTLEQAVQEHRTRYGAQGWVFDCRGLGSQPEWQGLRGVRGEVIRLHAPDVKLLRPTRLLHPRYPLYLAPKPGNMVVIGATEIEADDSSPASVRSVLELLSAAYAVHPGFAEARIVEISTQRRPTLAHNLPELRVMAPRVLQINGLYRHGFLVAPALLDAVLQWMAQHRSPLAEGWGLHITRGEPCTS